MACGQIVSRLIGYEYTTAGMPPSIPGDSGGTVWHGAAGRAIIVGIWLAERISDDNTSYGRFTTLPDALFGLAVSGMQD